jgi:hypothetical protein
MRWWTRGVLVLLLLLVTPAPARAYLDPGSGSMMVQVILGGLAGLAVLIKMFWRRIIGRFKRDSPPSGGQ